MHRPRIAITMGDPAGVGPELCLKVLSLSIIYEHCVPVIFGDAGVLARVGESCGLQWPCHTRVLTPDEWPSRCRNLAHSAIVDSGAIDAATVRPGFIDGVCGKAAFHYIEAAIHAALVGEVAAVTTGPINKESLHLAGVSYPGHTEIFAARTEARRTCMMLTSDSITVSFVTTHIGYADVPGQLSSERILDVIELTAEAMRRLRGREVSLVVCGLNPHAGEHGLFGGGEEERLIAPAIALANRRGIPVQGPIPPDAAFLPARRHGTDAFVCMYHDQGHIPLKMLAFDKAVNVTLGLPIVRTSVDHGTAFDIAWSGQADPRSLIEAVILATRLARGAP
jgi:4-phospho-D-threonate 3-dehydrogenase / 4-phospho-D-erythronate 3-dehydrogenase